MDKIKLFFKNKFVVAFILLLLPFLVEFLIVKNIHMEINRNSVLRIGYMFGVYFIIFIFYILNKYSKIVGKICDFLLKYRYVLALLVFITLVACKINFSSIGIWSTLIPESGENKTTILGISRSIRSDEWLTQTPFALSQTLNDDPYSLTNENVGQGNENMIMVSAPTKDITLLAKPFNIGYVLFGGEYGLAWSSCLKMISLILVGIEIAMILSKRDKLLSLVGGLWIALSPITVWWLSTGVVDSIIYGFSLVILFHYFISNPEWNLWKKLLLAFGVICMLPAFILVLYPAMQVPLAYVMLVFVVCDFIKYNKNLHLKEYIIMILSVIFGLLILAYFIYVSWDTIQLTMSTVYPGSRFEQGGDIGIIGFIRYFISFFTPFVSPTAFQIQNYSEVSCCIYPTLSLIIVIIANIKDIKLKLKDKSNYLIIGLIIVYIIQALYVFCGFGKTLSTITLLFVSPATRVLIVVGIIGVMLCIALLKILSEKKKIFSKLQSCIISLVVVFVSIILIKAARYDSFLTVNKLIVLLPIIFAMSYTFIRAYKKAFCYIVLIVTIFTGASVNPLTYGTGAIYDTNISKEIKKIDSNDSDVLWAGKFNWNGQFLIANGVSSLNGVNFVPNYNWINKVDPEKKYEEVYNRFAHINIELSNETKFVLNGLDNYSAYITYEDAKNIGIKYYLTNKKIETQENSYVIEEFNLELIYDGTDESQYIYEIN